MNSHQSLQLGGHKDQDQYQVVPIKDHDKDKDLSAKDQDFTVKVKDQDKDKDLSAKDLGDLGELRLNIFSRRT